MEPTRQTECTETLGISTLVFAHDNRKWLLMRCPKFLVAIRGGQLEAAVLACGLQVERAEEEGLEKVVVVREDVEAPRASLSTICASHRRQLTRWRWRLL